MEHHSPIRLLVADDNLEICDILADYFRLTPEVELCGVAHDGQEVLFRIAQIQPDVVLLDLIMPKMDGLSVLEKLSSAQLPCRPRVIVCSAIGQEGFTRAALKMGADYYMIKPYDLSDLLNRIQLVASLGAPPVHQQCPTPSQTGDPGLSSAIVRAVMEMAIPAHMLGYQYIVAAMRLLLGHPRPCSIVKDVYATLALDFSTTGECVEGAIRKALRAAWRQDPAPLQALVGGDMTALSPPSNGRFLFTLAQRLRLERGEETV